MKSAVHHQDPATLYLLLNFDICEEVHEGLSILPFYLPSVNFLPCLKLCFSNVFSIVYSLRQRLHAPHAYGFQDQKTCLVDSEQPEIEQAVLGAVNVAKLCSHCRAERLQEGWMAL